jgi:nucleotide-binding universal stress UspA family protein
MTQHNTLTIQAESVHYKFANLLVAYDFSEAAKSALKYAIMLTKCFGASIQLISVQSPADNASPAAMKMTQHDFQDGLNGVEEELRTAGIRCNSVRRMGSVSDSIRGAMLENTPDLLLLGAFGYGPIDRCRLGSTAEDLLRTGGCPTLVLGPQALLRERLAPSIERILCVTNSLRFPDDTLSFAGYFAIQMGAQLELLHIVDPEHKSASLRYHEQRCEERARSLRTQGSRVSWALFYGQAEDQIVTRTIETRASLVLFGLHPSGKKMIDCPDSVLSATIRRVHCPVMAVPSAFPHQEGWSPLIAIRAERSGIMKRRTTQIGRPTCAYEIP